MNSFLNGHLTFRSCSWIFGTFVWHFTPSIVSVTFLCSTLVPWHNTKANPSLHDVINEIPLTFFSAPGKGIECGNDVCSRYADCHVNLDIHLRSSHCVCLTGFKGNGLNCQRLKPREGKCSVCWDSELNNFVLSKWLYLMNLFVAVV